MTDHTVRFEAVDPLKLFDRLARHWTHLAIDGALIKPGFFQRLLNLAGGGLG